MDDYIFRRELDFQTDFPEMIVKLKKDRHIRKMDLADKKELYDHFYATVKEHFLLDHILKEEKYDLDNAATEQIYRSLTFLKSLRVVLCHVMVIYKHFIFKHSLYHKGLSRRNNFILQRKK